MDLDRVRARMIEILQARRSRLALEVERVADPAQLPLDVKELIADELGEEFSAKGLRADSEPNEYGLELERLTDALKLGRR
jgi:hypothetical protein